MEKQQDLWIKIPIGTVDQLQERMYEKERRLWLESERSETENKERLLLLVMAA